MTYDLNPACSISVRQDSNEWYDYPELMEFGDYAESVEYINQSEYGDGQLEGEWFYCDDNCNIIYFGTFGNYNSPGADSYTTATIFDKTEEGLKEYQTMRVMLTSCPEYLPSEEKDDE